MSQNRLAVCARLNQSRLNKIANGKIKDVDIDSLVCVCLALSLNEAEAKDLLARKERAFSPASRKHEAYLELIRLYAEKEIDYTTPALSSVLDEADSYLAQQGFSALPNANI